MTENNTRKFTTFDWVKLVLILAVLLVSYYDTLGWMKLRWTARGYYSHGPLIPLVSAYFIWSKREKLKKLPYVPSRWGLPLVVMGLFIHVMSSFARVYFTSGFSLVIVLIGLSFYLFGREVGKELIYPLCFLFFMTPLNLLIIEMISFRMKLFAATISNWIVNSVGIDAAREGSFIHLPNGTVEVGDVCSGLRSLISLTALGVAYAYMAPVNVLKKGVIVLAAVPMALISNVIRIVLLCFVGYVYGIETATGTFIHKGSGFLVFVVALIGLMIVGRMLCGENTSSG